MGLNYITSHFIIFNLYIAFHPSIEKINQEKASLLNIDDSFKKIIIVKDRIKPFLDENGILTINLFDFLLNKESLDL